MPTVMLYLLLGSKKWMLVMQPLPDIVLGAHLLLLGRYAHQAYALSLGANNHVRGDSSYAQLGILGWTCLNTNKNKYTI